MKQHLFLCLPLALTLLLSACGSGTQGSGDTEPLPSVDVLEPVIEDTKPDALPESTTIEDKETESMEKEKILRFLVGEQEILAQLNDNPTAEALYEMAPTELSFEDFNGTEKIAHPPEELPTEGSPDNCDPETGNLCYYIPWGNLCFFYQDFRQSPSLIPLGTVTSGSEYLEQLDTVEAVTVEPAE